MTEFTGPAGTLGAAIRYMYQATRKPWGGTTFHWQSYRFIKKGTGYALSIRPADMELVEVPIGAEYEEFEKAFTHAATTYPSGPGFISHWVKGYIGVFRNEDRGMIEFDPVMIVPSKKDVDMLACLFPVSGGAYEFATGNGYWPDKALAA